MRNVPVRALWQLRGWLAPDVSHLFAALSVAEASERLSQLKSGLGTQLPAGD